MSSFPMDYARLRFVQSFAELVSTPLAGGVNALCWPRRLPGGFDEVALALGPGEGIVTLDADRLNALELSDEGQAAREILLADQAMLAAHGLEPVLDCIHGCERDESEAIVPTDVFSFHADSATGPVDTYLCSYNVSSTEALRNEEAVLLVEVPEIRRRLLAEYGGADDEGFHAYLDENCYDLHYAPLPGARPFAFGIGNLWRVATVNPVSLVPPCIHRAPEIQPGMPPRLLLLS